ncbi:hypothetical protein [Devosia sp. 63-57]|uniref:hypothetical protein n=1 Tax=Devosia sp. 63-57 TaxID=1895751 RepID=UPI000869F6DA|nr:hypothetical protein [Devosia sp. 63-57]ODT50248.1 MAG: hypothetical protein ABS74_04845 [Pelagibacterium sp. SCN 63-126]ODU83027.1 MAG: hypothetical protein ABT14_16220 [Pelagibacterium sp. SCN 63-17]OJX44992.1 MAG: hypothetical protein BGO80_03845 [Devosia sp. 63-57]
MALPDLSQLPPLAVIAFGISLAIIIGLAWLGERRGKAAGPASSQSSAQVAAVIVDPTALQLATKAVDELTGELRELRRTGEEIAEGHAALAKGIDRIREEMRLDRELRR